VFGGLYFQTFWPKWLNFFRSFRKHFGLWPEKSRRWHVGIISPQHLSISRCWRNKNTNWRIPVNAQHLPLNCSRCRTRDVLNRKQKKFWPVIVALPFRSHHSMLVTFVNGTWRERAILKSELPQTDSLPSTTGQSQASTRDTSLDGVYTKDEPCDQRLCYKLLAGWRSILCIEVLRDEFLLLRHETMTRIRNAFSPDRIISQLWTNS